MINSMFLAENYLFALSSTATLSVYNLVDLMSLENKSLPKLESFLGISLRQATASFGLESLSQNAKILNKAMQINSEVSVILIYDENRIIGLNLSELCSNSPTLKFQFIIDGSSFQPQKESIKRKPQIFSICILEGQKGKGQRILVTKTSGTIHIINQTSLMNFQEVKSMSLTEFQKSKSSQIITEAEENSFGLFNQTYNQAKTTQVEYVCTTETDSKSIYLATNKHRLLKITKDKLQIQGFFDPNGSNDIAKIGSIKALSNNPIKIILLRNHVLVLYPKLILEFNAYTHILTNTIALPASTLDLSIMESSKTLQSSLLLVGQYNNLYSLPYPITEASNKSEREVPTRSVNISSRIGKKIQVQKNIVFIGGSDGTVDVLLNGEMLMAVLVKEK